MPVHGFNFNQPGPANLKSIDQDPKTSNPAGAKESQPIITRPIRVPDKTAKDTLFYDQTNINIAEDVAEILPPGFRTMDRGLKNYFSGIRIPTVDGYRMMNVRIAGADKTFLIWNQDLRRGRVTLPVMSISRGSATYNINKFSPPHHYMSKRFADNTGSRIIAAFRPDPYLIEYTLSIWAEHKADAEHATYQINTRFHPLAEFVVEDEYLRGNIIMKLNDWSDASDKDIDAETRPNVRYDISITMEGWLPLPEKLLPSILGRVTTFKEDTGEFLEKAQGPEITI